VGWLPNDRLSRGLSCPRTTRRGRVIFYEGTNDITGGATTAQLIAGMQEVIDRIHARGVPVYVGTVIPRGRPAPLTGWTASMEQVKLEVNHWINTEANVDGIVEFGALLDGPIVIDTDGSSPRPLDRVELLRLHPSQQVRAQGDGEFIDLDLFKP
jgi:hypothetical protein